MRILAGRHKGRLLKRPSDARLTSEKVKGAFFNIVADTIHGAAMLDLCAGSGSVGLEALSRGADHVTWVEQHPASAKVLLDNVRLVLGGIAMPQARLLRQDAPAAVRQLAAEQCRFDFIFFDPPYRDIPLLKKTLQAIGHHAILRESGWLVVEHERRTDLPQLVDSLEVIRQYRYGDTVLSFCRQRSEATPP